jgi:hypothetical protein
MKKFNLNDYILVQITEYGMSELLKQNGQDFITHCILPRKKVINGEDWYRLQAHNIPDWFGNMLWFSNPAPIKPDILIP